MGTTRWDPTDWDDYVTSHASMSTSAIFSRRTICSNLDPKDVAVRESCDSEMNPNSTPIIVAVDNTGSMGMLAETLIRQGLGVLIEEILDRKPVTDPHVMFMAVGDAWCDQAPLQVTQFETDIRIASQLADFWVEGGGGGNDFESYNLPWYFAAKRTKCDAILKRNKKGYLFTVGDEPPPPALLAKHVQKFLGGGLQRDISTKELHKIASQTWEIFHIMVEEGNYYSSHPDKTRKLWQQILGQRAMPLSDHRKLAEVIVSTLQVMEGADAAKVAGSWSGGTELVVRKSLNGLVHASTNPTVAKKGLIRL